MYRLYPVKAGSDAEPAGAVGIVAGCAKEEELEHIEAE